MSAQVKGSLLIPAQRFLASSLGAAGWDEFLGTLDAATARLLASGVLVPVAWYPFSVASTVVERVFRMKDGDERLRALGRASLDYGTNVIFKLIFKIGTPQFMIARSDVVWRTYYSTGAMRVLEAAANSATAEIVDFPEITPSYERAVMHSMCAVVEKAGGKGAHGEVVDSAASGKPTRIRIAWG